MNPFGATTAETTATGGGERAWLAAFLMLGALVGFAWLYRFLRRQMVRRLRRQTPEQTQASERALFVFRYGYASVVFVLFLELFGDSLNAFGLSLALVGTFLGWALRAPVTNLAAWLIVIVRGVYRVGDRVVIGGNVGDIKDISVSYTQMEQVGGTVSGEEPSGRSLLIPNGTLFDAPIVNYRLNEPFILDEVPVRITFDSDLRHAEALLLSAARDALGGLVAETGHEPYVVHELIPSGVVSRVRYRVPPQRRPEVASAITARVYNNVRPASDVRFCYIQQVNEMEPAASRTPFPAPHWEAPGAPR